MSVYWKAFLANRTIPKMSTDTQELIRICEQLPEAKRVEVADFARFLLAQQGDERWEQIIASPSRRPKLDAFLRESAQEAAEPLAWIGSHNGFDKLFG